MATLRVARRPRVAGNIWERTGNVSGIVKVRKSQTSLSHQSSILRSAPRVAFFLMGIEDREASKSWASPSPVPSLAWPRAQKPAPFSSASRGCQTRDGLAKGLWGSGRASKEHHTSSDQPCSRLFWSTHPQLTPSPDTTDSSLPPSLPLSYPVHQLKH